MHHPNSRPEGRPVEDRAEDVAAVIFVALLAQGDLGGSMSFESGIVFSSGHHHAEEEESSHSESKAGQDDPPHSEPSPAHAAE